MENLITAVAIGYITFATVAIIFGMQAQKALSAKKALIAFIVRLLAVACSCTWFIMVTQLHSNDSLYIIVVSVIYVLSLLSAGKAYEQYEHLKA
jgi:uncharacterized protein YebE (UPF0316 family)